MGETVIEDKEWVDSTFCNKPAIKVRRVHGGRHGPVIRDRGMLIVFRSNHDKAHGQDFG